MSRMDRVNQMIRREISELLQKEIQDPRLEFVSITRVEVSPDLHVARVHFSVLGNSARVEAVQEGLNHARGFLRKSLGKRITLRFTPDLEFEYDPSIEYSARIEETLQEIRQEEQSRGGPTE